MSAESISLKIIPYLKFANFQGEYQRATSELVDVTGHFLASKATLRNFEQQAYNWKEECRSLILRSRDTDNRYEVEIVPARSEMTALAGEIVTLRAPPSDGSNVDDMLRARCTRLEVEREDCLARLRESDRQLALARREESEMEAYLRNSGEDHVHPQI